MAEENSRYHRMWDAPRPTHPIPEPRLNVPGLAAIDPMAIPEATSSLGSVQLIAGALGALTLTGLFALLRSGLLHAVPSRIAKGSPHPARRERLIGLLERAELLGTAASLFTFFFQLVFVVCVMSIFADESFSFGKMGVALLVCAPTLVFVQELIPRALRGERSDGLLRFLLPAFDLLYKALLLGVLMAAMNAVRRAFLRAFRVPERAPESRQFVDGIRDALEDAGRGRDLGENEREFIENALEFSDIDVTEIMTPRTELAAVDIEKGIAKVVETIAKSGHSRIPVFEGNLDSIIGVAYAQEVLQLVAQNKLENSELQKLLRPVPFVPETKSISQLLAEFRRDNQKIAVVLDEYGGTSGIVTVGDIVEEIVGDIPGELGQVSPEEFRSLADGRTAVRGTTRVSEVNEELEMDLPEEEDYETLAGFVLAEMGRFPKVDESFLWNGAEFHISEATDRRVLEVVIRPLEKKRRSVSVG